MSWTKYEYGTEEKSKTLQIARRLKMRDKYAVAGRLAKVWGWFLRESVNGFAAGMTVEILDDLADKKGFASAMVAVGWLTVEAGGLTLPGWAKWFPTQEAREAEADRKREARAGAASKSAAVPLPPPPAPAPPERPAPESPAEPPRAAIADFPPAPKFEVFAEAWNAAGLPPVPTGPDGRPTASGTARGHWQKLWNESPDFRARWRQAVERLGRSRKARGETKGEFCVKHTWFLKHPDIAAEVLDDGTYDDPPGAGQSIDDIFRSVGANIVDG